MEKDSCSLSEVYSAFMNLSLHQFPEHVKTKIDDRWAFLHTESMRFAYLWDHKTKGGRGIIDDDLPNTITQLLDYTSTKKRHFGISISDGGMKKELYDFLTFVADIPAAFAVHGEKMSAHQF
jgi:hypothetical protein